MDLSLQLKLHNGCLYSCLAISFASIEDKKNLSVMMTSGFLHFCYQETWSAYHISNHEILSSCCVKCDSCSSHCQSICSEHWVPYLHKHKICNQSVTLHLCNAIRLVDMVKTNPSELLRERALVDLRSLVSQGQD